MQQSSITTVIYGEFSVNKERNVDVLTCVTASGGLGRLSSFLRSEAGIVAQEEKDLKRWLPLYNRSLPVLILFTGNRVASHHGRGLGCHYTKKETGRLALLASDEDLAVDVPLINDVIGVWKPEKMLMAAREVIRMAMPDRRIDEFRRHQLRLKALDHERRVPRWTDRDIWQPATDLQTHCGDCWVIAKAKMPRRNASGAFV
jgi:hypothetical protein